MTLCFSANQARLPRRRGHVHLAFVGRLDDIAMDGMQLISDIVKSTTTIRP